MASAPSSRVFMPTALLRINTWYSFSTQAKPMRFFSEATLLKMETTWTQHRKELEAPPTFIKTWLYPTLLLKPNEIYTRKSYLQTAIVYTLAVTFLICVIFVLFLLVSARIVPRLWSVMLDPKNHAQQIGILSQEGFYLIPLAPLMWLVASFAFNWPTYFFWNRRAKRLQREGFVSVPIVAAAVLPDDPTIWPPPPRS